VPFVRAGRCIEYDDAVIEIAVGYVDLVCLRIDFRIGWTAETRNVIAVGLLARFADLQNEFSGTRELQVLAVKVAVSANPRKARRIDADAMLVLWPLIAVAWAAPSLEQISFAIKFHHRRSRPAAFGGRWIERQRLLIIRKRAGTLNDPDMVLRIDRNARCLAHYPVVGQRLGPGGVDLEPRIIFGRSRHCGRGNYKQ